MVKKTLIISFLSMWILSCASHKYRLSQPSIYLESLPQTIVTELSLDERIATEEAWKHLKEGNGGKAQKILFLLGAKSPAYYVGLGYANILLQRFQASEKHFKAGLVYYPDMILIHLGLAQLYQKTGRENLAFTKYLEVFERNPEHRFAKQEYEALKAKKTEEALEEGKYFLTIDNSERAKEAFLKALYYTPNSKEAHLTLAEIYKEENKLQDAIGHLEALSSLEPKNPQILQNYADTLFKAKQFEKSLEIYKEVLALQPDNKDLKSRIESIKNRLGIFDLPSQYRTIPSKTEVSKEEVASLLAVKFQGILEDKKAKTPIIIDISTSWASKFILKMTSLGLLDIYPNHTFQPNKIVTRAEMAEILIRLIKLLKEKNHRFIQQFPPEKIYIADLSPNNYYYKSITQIVSYQIMDLSSDKKFRPDQPLSGQETIRILDIILNLIK